MPSLSEIEGGLPDDEGFDVPAYIRQSLSEAARLRRELAEVREAYRDADDGCRALEAEVARLQALADHHQRALEEASVSLNRAAILARELSEDLTDCCYDVSGDLAAAGGGDGD